MSRLPAVRLLALATAVLAVASATAVVTRNSHEPAEAAVGATTTAVPTTSTTLASTTTTAPAPPPTVAVTTAPPRPATAAPRPPTTRKPAPRPAVVPLTPVPGTAAPFGGLGVWVDVYDWTAAYTKGSPAVGVAQIDAMADLGAQTLYIQGSRWDAADDVMEPDRLRGLIDRAHQRSMRVVTWYLPTFEDTGKDIRRLVALGRLNVEGVGVDIEDKRVADPAERSRRLVEVSAGVRAALPGKPLAAIPLPAVLMEEINRNAWPGFPYRELAPHYDAWMPMDYWTFRTASSGWRDAYRYTVENIARLRTNVGRPDLPVHPIGGLGEATTAADMDGFHRGSVEQGAIGGSIYDWRTTKSDAWPALQRFRR